MTLAEERDERAGRTPPEDPAHEFNGTASATAEDMIAQQAAFRQEDTESSVREKYKASVQRTSDMLDKLGEMQDRSTQQNIESIQKALGLGGQLFTQLAVTKKAQEGLKPVAGAIQALQGISSMLVQAYMNGSSKREMQAKIDTALEDTRDEIRNLTTQLRAMGIDPETLVSPEKRAELAKAGFDPIERKATAGAPTASA